MLAIIGGSGLYDLPGLADVRRERVQTPFGDPSDEILLGRLGTTELAFLPRHGKGHRLTPTELNPRANLWALKKLGADRVVSVSAVGSMKEEIAPGHLVLPTQYIDRTHARATTFFGGGIVAHVAFADPVCPLLHDHLREACVAAGITAHPRGTYVCIEGPQFSTRAESNLYRSWNVDVIGMTAMPEAKLAREAELCYATVALATDYDCWREGHEAVTVAQVVRIMEKNLQAAREVVRIAALSLPKLQGRGCGCGHALDSAVMTAPAAISSAARERVALLLGDRFKA
ncbi:MAG TPA: S-methyl-5'-thioadenosine phosphorylase [Myxococcales bacterium]